VQNNTKKNNAIYILPLINPQNYEFDVEQRRRHCATHSVHELGKIVHTDVHQHVAVLKDLSRAQHYDPV
jgi:hypothetical protein